MIVGEEMCFVGGVTGKNESPSAITTTEVKHCIKEDDGVSQQRPVKGVH